MNDDSVVVNGPILESDAEHVWGSGSETLAAMNSALPVIAAADFSAIPGAQHAARLYATARSELGTYIEGGAAEFTSLRDRLLKTVLAYDNAHDGTLSEICRIERELAQ